MDGLFPGDGYVQTRCPDFEWATVCADHWDRRDANAVCKQLGFPYAYGTKAAGTPTTNLGNIVVNNVYCSGEEDSFGKCQLVNDQPECFGAGSKSAGVQCTECKYRCKTCLGLFSGMVQ